MLTRRHIRVKVMQSIYALHQHENYNLQKEEKFLQNSMENMHGLYATLMGLLCELFDYSKKSLQIAKNKYFINHDEMIFDEKFIENRILLTMLNDAPLQEFIPKKSLVYWPDHDEYLSILHRQMQKSKAFERYLKRVESNWQSDAFLLLDLYREVIATDEKLFDFLQDSVISFVDDFPIVNTLITKIIKSTQEVNSKNHFVPELYKNTDDQNFGIELIRKSVLNDQKYHQFLKEKISKDWEIDRIALLDAIIIKLAISEFLGFPSIPVRVTINEYLEIAKEYCTPMSISFINGVLDRLSKEFQEKKMLPKIGRGLN